MRTVTTCDLESLKASIEKTMQDLSPVSIKKEVMGISLSRTQLLSIVNGQLNSVIYTKELESLKETSVVVSAASDGQIMVVMVYVAEADYNKGFTNCGVIEIAESIKFYRVTGI